MATQQKSSLEGKIAIVTGGSRGLGQNTVLHLAKRGVKSIFTYNSSQNEADRTVAEVEKLGAKAVALKVDVGNVNSFVPFLGDVNKALGEFGASRFDFLVNNAAVQCQLQGCLFLDTETSSTD